MAQRSVRSSRAAGSTLHAGALRSLLCFGSFSFFFVFLSSTLATLERPFPPTTCQTPALPPPSPIPFPPIAPPHSHTLMHCVLAPPRPALHHVGASHPLNVHPIAHASIGACGGRLPTRCMNRLQCTLLHQCPETPMNDEKCGLERAGLLCVIARLLARGGGSSPPQASAAAAAAIQRATATAPGSALPERREAGT